jgi:uncharacterized protein YjiS (DUF1127 family)
MNAPIAKDQFSFSLGNLSYIDSSYDEGAAPIVDKPKHGLGTWLDHLFQNVAEWQRRQSVMRELTMMTDRELSDIGLSRSDLSRVFDSAFAAEHARNRAYIAY